MKIAHRIAFALVFAATAFPTFAADYFWECTTAAGVRYWDASKCDRSDRAVKVMKGDPTQLTQNRPAGLNPQVCPANPDHCALPNDGEEEAPTRAQAITHFMRKKQCEFLKRYPERCANGSESTSR